MHFQSHTKGLWGGIGNANELHNEEIICENKGFRFIDKTMKTYEQDKIGLSQIYIKGVVMEDGIHVRPLDI